MKSPRSLSVLLASGGLALAVSLSAQSTPSAGSSAPGTKSGATEKSPVPNKPVTPNPSPHDPSVTSSPNEQKPGAGLTPGAANSGSGAGGRETMPAPASSKDSSSTADPFASRNQKPNMNSAGFPQFSTLDADRDGRISQTEFTSPSAAWLRDSTTAGTSSDSVKGSDATARGPLDKPSSAATPTPRVGAATSGSSTAPNNAQLFQQVDTNRDGYLSPTELEAYRAPTSSER